MRHLGPVLVHPVRAVLLARISVPAAAERVLVIELSSPQACPVADAVLADLAQGNAALLLLDPHGTYFDRAG